VLVKCAECGHALEQDARFCDNCGHSRDGVAVAAELGSALLERLRQVTVGRYEVRGELGRGGMAAVFLAYDLALNRRVALKVMLPGLAYTEGMAERFRLEARTAANLDHPNIVTIYSVDRAEDLQFFSMKYIEGRSLERVLRDTHSLPVDVSLYIIGTVAGALQYAHDQRVIHRDVKPGNVLLDKRGTPVVSDFGIAKAADRPSLTQSGAIVGTALYMSPEQFRGKPAIPASDQYALGVMAYEMLVGEPPFTGGMVELQLAHVTQRPTPPRDRRRDIPAFANDLVMRMLEKSPEARWSSLASVVDAIQSSTSMNERSVQTRLVETGFLARTDDVPGLPATPVSPLVAGRKTAPRADQVDTSAARGPTEIPVPRSDAPQRRVEVGDQESRVSGIVAVTIPQLIEVGDVAQLTANAVDTSGRPLPRGVSWSTRGSTAASVGAGGSLTALAPGMVTVVASAGDARAEFTVRVVEPRVAELVLGDIPAPLGVGESVMVGVRQRDRRGRELSGHPVSWASRSPGVATVDAGGRVSGVGFGETVIDVQCEDATTAARVSVGIVPVSGLEVRGLPRKLKPGSKARLAATATDAQGRVRQLPVSWTSSNEAVATVDQSGMLTVVADGEAAVRVRSGSLERSLPIEVRAPVPFAKTAVGALMTPRRMLAGAGALVVIAALTALVVRLRTPAPEAGDLAQQPGGASQVVSPPPQPLEPSPQPSSGATGAGSGAESRVPSAEPRTTAESRPVVSIQSRDRIVQIDSAAGHTFQARVNPGGSGSAPPVAWSSSDPTVAAVNTRSGVVTALRSGMTQIVATAGEASDSITLVVRSRPVSSQIIPPVGPKVDSTRRVIDQPPAQPPVIRPPQPDTAPARSAYEPPPPTNRPLRNEAAVADAIRNAAQACMAAFSNLDKDQIDRLGQGGSSDEDRNLQSFKGTWKFDPSVRAAFSSNPAVAGDDASLS
jgi:serine/threonine protein kinase